MTIMRSSGRPLTSGWASGIYPRSWHRRHCRMRCCRAVSAAARSASVCSLILARGGSEFRMLMVVAVREMIVLSPIVEQGGWLVVGASAVPVLTGPARASPDLWLPGVVRAGHKEAFFAVAHCLDLAQKDRMIAAGIFGGNASVDKSHRAIKNWRAGSGCIIGGVAEMCVAFLRGRSEAV